MCVVGQGLRMLKAEGLGDPGYCADESAVKAVSAGVTAGFGSKLILWFLHRC